MMSTAHDYNIVIRHGIFEGESCYEAKVFEFIDLVEYADSHNEAYELMIDAIKTTQDIFNEKGKKLPVPSNILGDDYSGRVTLRMPKTLHKEMSITAKREETSLNQYLLSIISFGKGFQQGESVRKTDINLTLSLTNKSKIYQGIFNLEDDSVKNTSHKLTLPTREEDYAFA